MTSSDELVELSRQLTTAPDYLLKSSLLSKMAEPLTDRSNTALHWKDPSGYEDSRKMTQTCKLSTEYGRSFTFGKIENILLTSQLASSLTENRLLKQLETQDISQKMSQLCVAPSLISATKEKVNGACSAAVVFSVTSEVTSTVLKSKAVKKQQKIKRTACDTKGTAVAGKPKLKHVKKMKLAVSEEVENDEIVSRFELPDYELVHEDVKSEEVELFVPPEKEEMVERLLRPDVDVPSIKVVIWLLST